MDFVDVPFVDNHAHSLTRAQPTTALEFRSHFTEAHSPELAFEHVGSAVFYRWALHQLGQFLKVDQDESAILLRRSSGKFGDYVRELIAGANIAYLLIDEGFPPPELSYSSAELQEMAEIPVRRILRIEMLLEDLLQQNLSLSDLISGFDAVVSDPKGGGFVALKSIAAYRTGLQIAPVSDSALAQAHASLAPVGTRIRLSSKPLVDYFALRALRHASVAGIPMQFHTGYGDPDLDLRLANPLHLRPLFEEAELSGAPIVMLHGSFPYIREAAYLAAVYPNAYLDIAFSLPPLDWFQLSDVVTTALGVAPASKILCSSDGTQIPEHYWLGATRARKVLSSVLTAMQQAGELTSLEAEEVARKLLFENAVKLYHLSDLARL